MNICDHESDLKIIFEQIRNDKIISEKSTRDFELGDNDNYLCNSEKKIPSTHAFYFNCSFSMQF